MRRSSWSAYAGWPRMTNAVREFGKVLEADAGAKKTPKQRTREGAMTAGAALAAGTRIA